MANDKFHNKKKAQEKKEQNRANTLKKSQKILILCEGTKTEPNYFNAMIRDLRLTSVKSKGCGITPKNILEIAIAAVNDHEEKYDEVWCVFDRDDFGKENFNAAFEMAEANIKIHIAFTNNAFELWYLLHFNYHDTALHRNQYEGRLTSQLKTPYQKNSTNMYETLLDKQPKAIKNAEKLYSSYENHNPESDNPSTTIHLLIKKLNSLS